MGVASVRVGPVGDQVPLTILHMVQGRRLHLRFLSCAADASAAEASEAGVYSALDSDLGLSWADVQVLPSCASATCFPLWLASPDITMSMGE